MYGLIGSDNIWTEIQLYEILESEDAKKLNTIEEIAFKNKFLAMH